MKAKMPTSVRVGPYDVSVRQMNEVRKVEDDGPFGSYHYNEQEIRLRAGYSSEAMAVDTLIHELLHAIWHTWGIGCYNKQEKIITPLATGITQVLRSNPDLRKYLNAALTD